MAKTMRLGALACVLVIGCASEIANEVSTAAESSSSTSDAPPGRYPVAASGGSTSGGMSTTAGTRPDGDESTDTGDLDEWVPLVGTIEAGPFAQGSTVEIGALGPTGKPTGVTLFTEVLDDSGAFGPIEVPAGPVLVRAEGTYFDVVANAMSDAPLRLEVVALANGVPVRLNLISHIASGRVLSWLGNGVEAASAIATGDKFAMKRLGAQRGLLSSAYHLESRAYTHRGPDSYENAVLLGTTAALQSAARTTSPGDPTGELQLLIDALAADEASFYVQYEVERLGRPGYQAVELAVLGFYEALGLDAERIQLERIVDVDNDGGPDTADNCPEFWNFPQTDVDDDGIGDSCDCDLAGPDHDGDGWPNGCDNCKDIPNLPHDNGLGGWWANENWDFDPWGNACDSCPRTEGVGGVEGENCCDPRGPYHCFKSAPLSSFIYTCALHSSGDRFECTEYDYCVHGYQQVCGGNNWPRLPPGALPSPQPCFDPDVACETKWCTVGNDAACSYDGVSCIPWFADGTAPDGLEMLGICAIADAGPCAGLLGRECAGW